MEDKTMRILNEFLLSEGTTWADLTNTQRKLFETVMTEICRRVPFLEQADQMRKENAINQSSIARALGVERKTVGSNNKLVAKLIDKYSTNEQKSDISGARYAALQKDLATTTAQFDAMVSHVIDIENVKTELKIANDLIREKNIQIANFEKCMADLRQELDHYRRKELVQDRKSQDIEALLRLGSDSKQKS